LEKYDGNRLGRTNRGGVEENRHQMEDQEGRHGARVAEDYT